MTAHEFAEALINDDAVGVFTDSNAGQAAALAAADLLQGWETYDAAYITANRPCYTQEDVTKVIAQLQAWAAKGCPTLGGAR